ncbi:MAG: hypothetical protein ACRDFY_09570 [Candidatus Limnocylindria bacterium]
MGPDPRIAEFISANRRRLTREAITAQLREAGHAQEAIDATWAALDARDPDDIAGEGFWGRFWVWLIGMNVAVWLLVGIATQMLPNSIGLAAILGIALAIGAAISLGLVALTRPDRLGRGAAIAIGAIVPLFFTFLIAGACYALVGAIGQPPPPPLRGTLTLRIEPPLALEATGPASCQPPPEGESAYNVYTEPSISTSEGAVSVFINAFGDAPAAEPVPMLGITIEAATGFVEYQPAQGGSDGVTAAPGSNATSGSLAFEGFLPVEAFDEQGQPIDRFDADPISGSVDWSCGP